MAEFKTSIFFRALNNEADKQGLYNQSCLDPIGEAIILALANTGKKEMAMSSRRLGTMTNTTRDRVRYRLPGLARLGLIHVVNSWRDDGTNRKKPMMISLNPAMLAVLKTGTKPAMRLAAVRHFTGLALRRLDMTDEDVQGFDKDFRYGDPDTSVPFTEEKAELKLADLISAEDQKKAEIQRQNIMWRERGKKFIESAAELWIFSQHSLGYADAVPNWAGDPAGLPPAARRERRELEKTFEQYGGRVTAAAWLIFTGGTPDLDPKTGQPTFDRVAPHRQFTSIDKKPSHFAKHFNAILKDQIMKDVCGTGWSKYGGFLKKYFGENFEIGPRDGSDDYQKSGLIFGENMPDFK